MVVGFERFTPQSDIASPFYRRGDVYSRSLDISLLVDLGKAPHTLIYSQVRMWIGAEQCLTWDSSVLRLLYQLHRKMVVLTCLPLSVSNQREILKIISTESVGENSCGRRVGMEYRGEGLWRWPAKEEEGVCV